MLRTINNIKGAPRLLISSSLTILKILQILIVHLVHLKRRNGNQKGLHTVRQRVYMKISLLKSRIDFIFPRVDQIDLGVIQICPSRPTKISCDKLNDFC